MKKERQQTILRLVNTSNIYTQAELTTALQEVGYSATQATISRDIRELRLTKQTTDKGQKYIAPEKANGPESPLSRIFREGLVSADHAGNMLVIRTLSGMAMAVALALDKMNLSELLGTVAGDDVVICVVRTEHDAMNLAQKFSL